MGEVTTGEAKRRLGVSVPTVRAMWERGDIVGRLEAHQSRDHLLIDEDSITVWLEHQAETSDADSTPANDGRLGGVERAVAQLTEQVGALSDRIGAIENARSPAATSPATRSSAAATNPTAKSPTDPAPAGTAADLRQALRDQRAVTDAVLKADEARARVTTHLLAALQAAEEADGFRRAALTASQATSTSLVTPATPPPGVPPKKRPKPKTR